MIQQEAGSTPASTATDLWKQAVALIIETRRMGVRRVLTGYGPEGTNPERVRLSKAILAGEEYLAIARSDRRIRAEIGRLSLPISAFFKGAALVPLALLEETERRLGEWQTTRRALIARFVEAYPLLIERARLDLGPLFDQRDYPPVEEVRELFSERVQYLSFDVPGTMQAFSRQAAERAVAEQKARVEQAVAEIRTFLRHGFVELVSHLRQQLEPDAAGRRKTVRRESVTGFLEFLDTFQARNAVAQDAELANLVNQVRQFMAGVSPDDLRTDVEFQQAVKVQIDGLREELDQLLAPAGVRRYDLS